MGDLTYPYTSLNGSSEVIKEIIEKKHKISDCILEAKKPLVILGQSVLSSKSGKYIFESLKKFLYENNKCTEKWNSFNVISNNASTVGSYDLGIYQNLDGLNSILSNLQNHKFDFVYLLGQDNLNFKKENEFIVYQGSHGDKGAEIADIILPSAAYTEQNGYYTNLEGKMQKAYKASYPPGEAKEDWNIFNEISEHLNNKKLFKDYDELESSMLNYLNLFYENDLSIKPTSIDNLNFIKESINLANSDYYYSNVISRSSKTMSDCRNMKLNIKQTGTEG